MNGNVKFASVELSQTRSGAVVIVTIGGVRSWRTSGNVLGTKSTHPLPHGAGPSQKLATPHQYWGVSRLLGIVILAVVPDSFATGRYRMNVSPQFVSDPRSLVV